MIPRLAVPRDDADWLIDHRNNDADADTYVVRMAERPTMIAGPYNHVRAIPEGARVDIGWWGVPDDRTEPIDWYHVTYATLAEVRCHYGWTAEGDRWTVLLTNIEP